MNVIDHRPNCYNCCGNSMRLQWNARFVRIESLRIYSTWVFWLNHWIPCIPLRRNMTLATVYACMAYAWCMHDGVCVVYVCMTCACMEMMVCCFRSQHAWKTPWLNLSDMHGIYRFFSVSIRSIILSDFSTFHWYVLDSLRRIRSG